MYGLVVKFTLRPGATAEFDHLVGETLRGIEASEPGSILYLCHEVEGEPDARIFYEFYESEAALQDHEDQPHVRRFLEEREKLMLSPPRVEFLPKGRGKGWPSTGG